MLKLTFLLVLLTTSEQANAQIPANYYNTCQGLNGTVLRLALHHVIDNHTVQTYASLWQHFEYTDKKNNGKVWDMYSDQPGNTPAYEYNFGTDECGNYNSEGDCFNREHSWPKSIFNDAAPMNTDLFHIYPTDGYVNGLRGNFPFGEVSSGGSTTTSNGSRKGQNVFPGAPNSTAFEPIDEYKGDFARTYFYMCTRYYTEDNSWKTWDMSIKTDLNTWAKNMLLQWHHEDPVSSKEINRNNQVFLIQGNRNPFIDSPVYADCIWGTGDCSATNSFVTTSTPTSTHIYPNPATDFFIIENEELIPSATVLRIVNSNGQDIFKSTHIQNSEVVNCKNWPAGWYFIFMTDGKNYKSLRFQKN